MTIMGILSNLVSSGKRAVASYNGDTAFLAAATSAAANVIYADGKVEESELDAAISGMAANPILAASYTASKIEDGLTQALARAKTRAGKMENRRFIEAVAARPLELRQDVFLIGADVADADGSMGDDERRVLDEVAKILNVDAGKLLG